METIVELLITHAQEIETILKEENYNNVVEQGLYMSELKDTKEFIEELEKRGY